MTDIYKHLLYELEQNSLDVVLAPSPEQRHAGHSIRAVQGRNPEWYRELCSRFQSSRNRLKKHGDTKVKRRDIIRLLEQLAAGKDVASKYKEFLVSTAQNMQEEFKNEMENQIPF
jgi:hypothetical protein